MARPIGLLMTLVSCALAGCASHDMARDARLADAHPAGHATSGWDPVTAHGHGDGADVVVQTAHADPSFAKGDAWTGPAAHTQHGVHLEPGPKAVADTDGPYLLDTGDQLRIFVFGQPNLSRLYRVDHAGRIVMPLIGNVHARGKTIYGLADVIRARLGAKFVRDPQVTVDIQENRPFFIMGEVRQGGQFPYVSGMTVKTAIAIAGGFSERANKETIRVTRRINGTMEVLDVPSDYVLKPGDLVEVKERFF